MPTIQTAIRHMVARQAQGGYLLPNSKLIAETSAQVSQWIRQVSYQLYTDNVI